MKVISLIKWRIKKKKGKGEGKPSSVHFFNVSMESSLEKAGRLDAMQVLYVSVTSRCMLSVQSVIKNELICGFLLTLTILWKWIFGCWTLSLPSAVLFCTQFKANICRSRFIRMVVIHTMYKIFIL